MRKGANIAAMLALVAAVQTAAASDRFVPGDGSFVVAKVEASRRDAELERLLGAWRASKGAAESTALAGAYLARARSTREPTWFGRAEAVLQPLVDSGAAPAEARKLFAELLQVRHDFIRAEAILDELIEASPRDETVRLARASIRLVRGNFAGARTDCAQVAFGSRGSVAGLACLAQALAGNGELERARAMLDVELEHPHDDSRETAYLLAVRAELRERQGDFNGATVDYTRSLELAPEDTTRGSLADLLSAQGESDAARALLDVERLPLALLVRRVPLESGAAREVFVARARGWLELEIARGDSPHWREAAMLGLAQPGAAREALAAARRNFTVQRELADIRLFARAAVAAADAQACAELERWLQAHAYHDIVVTGILARAPRR
jgi:tetratricopeptide (TPR) repeat protein